MAKITRTFGPIHFEDLDPKRFEDLVRELTYDFKDWQTIEATGRSGDDDGFDIRAFERAAQPQLLEREEAEEYVHPMLGNRWMLQCKREKEIGPKRLQVILDEIDESDPPYGYVLAACTNFSKKSYDLFRELLLSKGVMEFYLWGKAELEDMLHFPKNDRILFTFFGISLVSRRRSRATEIRVGVTNKNKLFRVLGEQVSRGATVLFRDAKDESYPFESKYVDFAQQPRWKPYEIDHYDPLGIVVSVAECLAYMDKAKKEYDVADVVSLLMVDLRERQSAPELRDAVEDYWEHLPKTNKAVFFRDGLVRYDAMLVIDDKGDSLHRYPHIYVDFDSKRGPCFGFKNYLQPGRGSQHAESISLDRWKRIKIFPDEFPAPTIATVHADRRLALPAELGRMIAAGNESIREFYDADKEFGWLKTRDVVQIDPATSRKESVYLQITHIRVARVDDLIQGPDPEWQKARLEEQVGRELQLTEKVTVFEFKRTYEWAIEQTQKLSG